MSTFSVGGLASGLDTKSIVEQLMSIEGRSKTKLEWSQQLLNARTSAWNDLKSRLSALQLSSNALLAPATWDVTASTSNPSGAWSATSGDPSRLGATVSGTPTAGTYAIDVLQLARAEISRSTGNLGAPTSGVRTTGMFYEGNNNVVEGNENITALRTQTGGAVGLNTNSTITMNYTVNGVAQNAAFKVNTLANGGQGTTLTQFASWVASTIGNGATASWVGGALQVTTGAGTALELDAMSFTAVNAAGTNLPNFNALAGASSSTTTAATDGGVAAADTLTINGNGGTWNVALAAGDQKQDIVNKINATSGIGVLATLNAGVIELRSTNSGAASAFTVSSTGSTAAMLGFSETQSAQDAAYTVNGTSYTSATNTNVTGAITDVSLNLLGTTSTTLTVAQATTSGQTAQEEWIDKVVAKVKDMVGKYNSVLDNVHTRTQVEKRNTNPKTLAEHLAGPMSHNVEYSNYARRLRDGLSDSLAGATGNDAFLSSIGITTSFSIGATATNGQLVLDEAALESALRADPARVETLLTQVGAGAGVTADDGFARRLNELAFGMVGQITDKQNYNLTPQSKRLQTQIDSMTDRLEMKRAYYEKMFSSLETSLGKLQSQSAWLSGQLASLSGSQSG